MTTPTTLPSNPQVADRLASFGSTIFTEISLLAIKHDAINLGQGFPNFDGPEFVKQAAIDAVNDGHGQYARSFGVPDLNRKIADRFQTDTGLVQVVETSEDRCHVGLLRKSTGKWWHMGSGEGGYKATVARFEKDSK